MLGRTNSESVTGSTVTTVYDALSRVKSRGSVGNTVNYVYDSEGNNTSLTYPSGRVISYAYDFAGNMKSLTSTGIGTVSFGYDANDTLTKTTLPNKVVETLTIDPLGRQSGILLKNSVTALNLYKNTKAYTSNGNLQSSSTSVGSVTPVVESYVHDVMNRTTKATSGVPNASGDFTYTSAGVLSSLAGETVTANNIGRPSAVGTKELGYDNLGQRTSETVPNSATRTLGWNADGTLANVSAGTGTNSPASYAYGADGLISSRTSGANSDAFTWDSTAENALMLSDGDYEYIYGPKRVPVAQVDAANSSIKYLHTDQNGSVVAATDNAGVLASQTNYGAYGKRLGASSSRFGFAGEWTDESTGYTFLRARWYDPTTASFLSEDPMVQMTGEAYGYAGGNPLTRVDPSGMFPFDPIAWIRTEVIDPIVTNVNKTIGSIKETASEVGTFVDNNSGTISSILGVTSFVTGLVPGLQGVSLVTGILSAALAGYSASKDVTKCVNSMDKCDYVSLGLNVAGTVTGVGGLGLRGYRTFAEGINVESKLVNFETYGFLTSFVSLSVDGIKGGMKYKNQQDQNSCLHQS